MINKLFFLLLSTLLISSLFTANQNIRVQNFYELYQVNVKDQKNKKELRQYIKYAEMCQLANRSNEQIKKIYPNAIIRSGSKNGVKLFLTIDHRNKHQTLIIRGSSNFKNWIANAKIFKKEDAWAKGADVHTGFYSVAREIYKISNKHLISHYKTTIAGHSLGGAAAVLMASYLERNSFKNIKVFTYGQPRITNSDGAHLLKGINVKRIVHEDDIVTMLPPQFLFYRHFGHLFELSENTSLTDNFVEKPKKDSKEVQKVWNQLESGEIEVQVNIKSHFIKNYIKKLYSLLSK
ncbi:MAG: hypothetical protein COB02_06430 [Candidatus Cloacimonadota bacterium]|nr:MAG: hypothetical protein COB02_06430 [Candidatus Cloacimonadota bacterium]